MAGQKTDIHLKRRAKMIEYLAQPVEFTMYHSVSLGIITGAAIGFFSYMWLNAGVEIVRIIKNKNK